MLASGLPERTFLNVNVPKGTPKGVRVTVQGKRNHVTTIARREDPRGLHYFWIEEGEDDWLPHDHSDYQACRDGYVSVTPLAAGHDRARGDDATRELLKVSRQAGRGAGTTAAGPSGDARAAETATVAAAGRRCTDEGRVRLAHPAPLDPARVRY